ncbi:MAG TPA: hypothetical protein DCG28_03760 [Lachnospiraceae bacterium]|nr:hypothetical protein [Lachnospiraceae bacterium]
MKKTIIQICTLIMILLAFVGCSAPEEVKKEADDRLQQYSPMFEEKVRLIYGNEAKLENIECPTLMNIGSPVPDVTHSASKTLTAKLKYKGASYDAYYDPVTDTLYDTIYADEICNFLLDCLPIDKSQVLFSKYTDASFETPFFEAGTDTFEKAALQKNSLLFNIITKEDLSAFKDYDFSELPVFKTLNDAEMFCSFTVVSLKDESQLSTLKGKIHELDFSTEGHPDIYVSETRTFEDVFKQCHIQSSLKMYYPMVDGKKGELRVRYNE